MSKLRIIARDASITMTAALNDSKTSKELLKLLPFESKAQTWGEEVYFETPLKMPEDNPHTLAPPGTIAYWPPDHAFCIFFGQTPYSPVNILGKLEGDPAIFARVRSGDTIRLEPAVKKAPKEREA